MQGGRGGIFSSAGCGPHNGSTTRRHSPTPFPKGGGVGALDETEMTSGVRRGLLAVTPDGGQSRGLFLSLGNSEFLFVCARDSMPCCSRH
jgi:hypothetical protein